MHLDIIGNSRFYKIDFFFSLKKVWLLPIFFFFLLFFENISNTENYLSVFSQFFPACKLDWFHGREFFSCVTEKLSSIKIGGYIKWDIWRLPGPQIIQNFSYKIILGKLLEDCTHFCTSKIQFNCVILVTEEILEKVGHYFYFLQKFIWGSKDELTLIIW